MKKQLILLSLCLGTGTAMAYEEPQYDVLLDSDDFEIRQYAPYIVAETEVDGDFRSSGTSAFRILAGYIFGDNRTNEQMAMTVPVESRVSDTSIEMAMTVPVTSARVGAQADKYTYAFVMESKYSMEDLPTPNDSRVQLREVPSRVVAVRKYSGLWSEGNYDRHETALLDAIAAYGLRLKGDPILARYNGPLTPWFLRRNEVVVEIEWPGASATPAR